MTHRIRPRLARGLLALSIGLAGLPALPALGGEVYRVTAFTARYAEPHPEHPRLAELLELEVVLGRSDAGFVDAAEGGTETRFRLAETPSLEEHRFRESAIRSIDEQLVRALRRRGLVGVRVEPSPEDLDPRSGADLRPDGRTELELVVSTARVKEIRTFASGDRFAEHERLDHPAHRHILEASPVRADGERDLMRKDRLDAYVARLNRHPGRRVDVQVSPARDPGGVYLDFLVAEYKPWFAYAELSNTGTESTTDRRERFGFLHTQILDRDDVLSLDYVTGDFDEVHAVSAYYDSPLGPTWLRGRAFASFSAFDASILGFSGTPFEGEQTQAGVLLAATVFQHERFFVAALAGLRFSHVRIENQVNAQVGEDDFLIPRLGLRVEQTGSSAAIRASLGFERNLADLAGTDEEEILNFGRFDADDQWWVMRWEASAWIFLEPLLFGAAWRDPSTPMSSTLAHELSLTARGQHSFGSRLIPQEMQTAGGLYSVRGYDEAVVAGDTAAIGSAEYRLHVPRLLRPRPEPVAFPLLGDFRVAPRRVYGRPDWDLVLRAFFDLGRTLRADRDATEKDETLMGAGAGVELLLWRNLSAQFDYAWALRSLAGVGVKAGSSEARFALRLLY